ncbi:uncharacterized protein N7483_001698 [Penicillium malachiteum]|uniref:uncharacterized protein n=1 Tax=Penicillium malachiteum TaxID=1324776 RepID=UPI0025470A79|nr:uncharacterized protein N7483_001698 [Penicillium malachiteum]KAJ5736573.1 hypothetical protein N7483_001698 [Penicillium malachiteum]
MDELLAPIRDALEGQIDFHGQRLAELLSTVLLVISGIVSFLVGYIYKDIYLTLWVGLGGTVFTALVVVPPWPFYNQNPEKWFNKSKKSGNPRVVVDGVKVA